MLDNVTKKNIDDCRDVLVGKVPDPKSQIEQITLALIYKFMDDMDKEAVEKFKGKAKFFTGKYSKYGWRKLFDPGLSGKEMLDLYSEALEELQINPNIPELFRNIFKNAYLPYRDPATLKMFLKHINEFEYSHSEKLGDAFEYLLSVMGSQGDAGQFRTPRHIIDFIVACVNPQKHETVADPACGTSGFLLSAYKHILKQNTEKRIGDKLKPDERKKLSDNIVGYDISPDMVRLSLANMYLHGFTNPHIYEYDSLSSEERWDESFDVILANPPFMTPKGGIRPHKKFSVKANKAEVLFTDYITEHLNKKGRAGIVVPNGIIATAQSAYKQLRKLLVDDSLIAVVSLPAGCFNPYSGVKTSILMLDKTLAKQSKSILFFKVNNDGFDLGAQRKEHEKNDLPLALEAFIAYKESILNKIEFNESRYNDLCVLVEKSDILKNKDFVLNGERYKQSITLSTDYPIVKLKDLISIQSGFAFDSSLFNEEKGTPLIRIRDIKTNSTKTRYSGSFKNEFVVNNGDLLIGMDGEFNIVIWNGGEALLNQRVCRITEYRDCLKEYIYRMIQKPLQEIEDETVAVTVKHISVKQIYNIEIPLPPLEIQKRIVDEIESFQKIVDGANTVVKNYKPVITIETECDLEPLGSLCDVVRGSSPRPQGDKKYYGGKVPRLMVADVTRDGMYVTPSIDSLTEEGASKSRPMKKGDVVMAVSGNPGLPSILAVDACIHDGFVGFRNLSSKIRPEFLYYVLFKNMAENKAKSDGAVFLNLTTDQIKEFIIPVPSLIEQDSIIKLINKEQRLVESNKQLCELFEQKIQKKLAQVWHTVEEHELA